MDRIEQLITDILEGKMEPSELTPGDVELVLDRFIEIAENLEGTPYEDLGEEILEIVDEMLAQEEATEQLTPEERSEQEAFERAIEQSIKQGKIYVSTHRRPLRLQ